VAAAVQVGPGAPSVRIGVAVPVPEPWGAELEGWRASFGDPQAASIPAHVTLLPPTAVGPDDLAAVEEHLAAAAAGVAPFPIHLRGTGTFRPVSPVVFVALATGIAGCERFPYHPHVTVALGLEEEALDQAFMELAEFDAVFTVESIRLYELSDDGWASRAVYPLRG